MGNHYWICKTITGDLSSLGAHDASVLSTQTIAHSDKEALAIFEEMVYEAAMETGEHVHPEITAHDLHGRVVVIEGLVLKVVVEITPAYTKEEMVEMGMIEDEHINEQFTPTEIDRKAWGSILTFDKEQAS